MPRPTKYSPNIDAQIEAYINKFKGNNDIPFLEELALTLNVDRKTLWNWSKHQDKSHLRDLLQQLKDLQRFRLVDKALHGKINTKVAIFMLKTNHGLKG